MYIIVVLAVTLSKAKESGKHRQSMFLQDLSPWNPLDSQKSLDIALISIYCGADIKEKSNPK